ncbi:MAG TPA: pyrophosphatase PpaX [Bacillota bacterium]|nr:pyrophosphatase PpaX [Bacillota bacterium]
MAYETILFDLDGTLVDTNELIHVSFKHTLSEYNYDFTDEEIMSFNGPPLRNTFEQLNPDLAEEMVQTYLKHNHALHEQYIKVFPNVIETLQALRKKGLKLGLVTAKMRNGVELGLEITGLKKYFDTIVTIDDVEHAKPHEEPVLKAMQALNGTIENTLMIGDNYHDILSGQNAEVATAGVAWTAKGRSFLEQYEPTYMLEDMLDLLEVVEG